MCLVLLSVPPLCFSVPSLTCPFRGLCLLSMLFHLPWVPACVPCASSFSGLIVTFCTSLFYRICSCPLFVAFCFGFSYSELSFVNKARFFYFSNEWSLFKKMLQQMCGLFSLAYLTLCVMACQLLLTFAHLMSRTICSLFCQRCYCQ